MTPRCRGSPPPCPPCFASRSSLAASSTCRLSLLYPVPTPLLVIYSLRFLRSPGETGVFAFSWANHCIREGGAEVCAEMSTNIGCVNWRRRSVYGCQHEKRCCCVNNDKEPFAMQILDSSLSNIALWPNKGHGACKNSNLSSVNAVLIFLPISSLVIGQFFHFIHLFTIGNRTFNKYFHPFADL